MNRLGRKRHLVSKIHILRFGILYIEWIQAWYSIKIKYNNFEEVLLNKGPEKK